MGRGYGVGTPRGEIRESQAGIDLNPQACKVSTPMVRPLRRGRRGEGGPTVKSWILGLVLSTPLVLLAAPGDKGKTAKDADEAGASHRAFELIKTERAAIAAAYSEDLFALAEECVASGGGKIGEEILGRVVALHTPPVSRRKTAGDSGVMAGAEREEGEGDTALVPSLPRAPVEPTAAEKKLVEVKAKAETIRARFTGTKDGFDERALKRIEGARQRATEKFVEETKKLALRCVKQGYPAHAYELLLWTLQFDPENKNLRKQLLRQKPHTQKDGSTRWYSAFELEKASKGFLLHPEYGWVRPDDVAALKAGKLQFNGKWLPKEKVEELRRDWANHWVYETEHFQIHTNAPLSDAVEFGREVEKLYAFFFRVFVDYYAVKGASDPALVFGGGKDLGTRKLWLNYYRSRESYLEACRTDPQLASDPLLPQSAGFYDPNTGKAYFYREEQGPDLTTIYHEVTHQIFGETGPRGPRPPTWMVEGLAVFMEDPVVRGEEGSERLLAGTEPPPGIRSGERSPPDLNEWLKACGDRDTFHGGTRRENYALAGTAVHFFMLYKGGRYRSGFVRWMQEAYKNSEPELPTRLSQLYDYCGVKPEKLQEDWLSFHKDPFPHLFDF